MVTIYIDGKPYQVDAGQNLLHICLSMGINLPYFCWHPAMGSVGACRQCAVKQFRDENDTRGRLVMACMTPAVEGLRISVQDPQAVEFRASIIEWLMENHPHDCPVCDEGGECHLQDMTVMTGHTYRHYRWKKRTFRNQNLGPFINHEMNRCIQCYRCVRFYRGFAGGRDFDAFSNHNTVYFGRKTDGVLESEFSGNLVEVCPTGVFTDKTFRKHYTRKWDLQTAPSVCVNCSLGCNTTPGERYGQLRRIRNRYNFNVNGYFLCDRGRYGYEFVNSDRRIRQARLRRNREAAFESVAPDEGLQRIKEIVKKSGRTIGIGSPRASLESNFALRTLVGPEHFFSGATVKDHELVTEAIKILRDIPSSMASLHEVETSDAALVLGEDVNNVAPMAAYALRQSVRCKPQAISQKLKISDWDDTAAREAVQDQKGPLYLATIADTRLDDMATRTFHASPQEIARLGFAVAHQISPTAPQPENLDSAALELSKMIAQDLKDAESPVVVSGCSLEEKSILYAAANVVQALRSIGKPARLFLTLPESNSLGLELLEPGSLNQAFAIAREDNVEAAIILENDLYRRSNPALLEAFFKSIPSVIVLDSLDNPTAQKADVLLPAATFAESDGTLVNNESRAQRYFQVFVPQDDIKESWVWLRAIGDALGQEEPGARKTFDGLIADMVKELPFLAPVQEISPASGFRIAGAKIPRQPHRYSGRTSMHANVSVHEPQPPQDPDSPLSFSMEGFLAEPPIEQPPASLIPEFWAPGWNSIQSLNKFQEEVSGPLIGGDPGKRIILPPDPEQAAYFDEIPEPFASRAGELLLAPLYAIYGSEELSIHTPGEAQLTPPLRLEINPRDAQQFNLTGETVLQVSVDSQVFELPLHISASIPEGTAGMICGLPEMPYVALPAWGKVTPKPVNSSTENPG
ncbi:MAG: NADH-quinone oxidoreductase subunit NuoG [Chloroflexi bacterium]|nr:NADH-quinone oxidoreductase subunit NuoG [Chloroflexota bacterium]